MKCRAQDFTQQFQIGPPVAFEQFSTGFSGPIAYTFPLQQPVTSQPISIVPPPQPVPSPQQPLPTPQQQFNGFVPVTKYIPYDEFIKQSEQQQQKQGGGFLKKMLCKKDQNAQNQTSSPSGDSAGGKGTNEGGGLSALLKLVPLSSGAPLAIKLIEFGLNKVKESKEQKQQQQRNVSCSGTPLLGKSQICINGPLPKAAVLYY